MHCLPLRVLVCGLGTLVCFLAVLMSAGIVLLCLVMLAALVMMRRFSMMVGRGLMFSRGKVMMRARFVLGFHWHLEFLLKNEAHDVAGQCARLVSATNFTLLGGLSWPVVAPTQANKKTAVANHQEVIGHVGLLVNEPPGMAGLLFI
jgi:hypothetical protein